MNAAAVQQAGEQLGDTFARLQHRLYDYLRRRVGDPTLAEDLLQEVFVKALGSMRADRVIENLPGWLYAVARTVVVDHYRARRPQGVALDENLPAEEPGEDRLHHELAECLRPLAARLAPLYRDALLATDFDGEKMATLAAREGVSLSAVKSRVSRARAMLRDEVLACCHVETAGGMVVDYRRRTAKPPACGCA